MPQLMNAPPFSAVEPVTEVLHGVTITDPYRWLEEQDSPRTREWLAEQQGYARSYLDSIPGRVQIRQRVSDLLDVETYDSVLQSGDQYFFRKRKPGQEQPCIFFRDGIDGADQLLIDPAERGTGPYTAVKPMRVSPNGGLLLYEVKQGGERTGTFEVLDIARGKTLPDSLPRGYLRGFVFSPDSSSFFYSHEPLSADRPGYRAVCRHVLGTPSHDDQEVFFAGENANLRLSMVSDRQRMGILVYDFGDPTSTDFYLWEMNSESEPTPIVKHAPFKFTPSLCDDGRIIAITDNDAPNYKIVEIRPCDGQDAKFIDLVPETDWPIQGWTVADKNTFVSYFRNLKSEIAIFDFAGKTVGQIPTGISNTVRLLGGDNNEEVLFERESFADPNAICTFCPKLGEIRTFAAKIIPFQSDDFDCTQVWFKGSDGTEIPMSLVGRKDLLDRRALPTIMTSYGGYGVPMTPQFSVLVAFLMERGCIFALPNIRGGSEFGVAWHEAAKRRKRQVAIDDFLSAANWLVESNRTAKGRLGVFGGSNSGLLVAAALTQRPDLFAAVLCMVPMLDMVRYHMFDNAHIWKDEFGTSESPEDLAALLAYSPYHNVRKGIAYPATMIVSGDADRNCNPLHARKMTARLQAANSGDQPIFLDYSRKRGHSPVLPLSHRVDALTDRLAFLCDRLNLPI